MKKSAFWPKTTKSHPRRQWYYNRRDICRYKTVTLLLNVLAAHRTELQHCCIPTDGATQTACLYITTRVNKIASTLLYG